MAWLALAHPKFQVENIRMVSDGDHVFEEELKEVWTTEFTHDLGLLEERVKEGKDHQRIWLLVCKVADSGCVMGAEGVRSVGNKMVLLAKERRYEEISSLLPTARYEFDEFNLLWGLYARTWRRRSRTFSL